MKKQYALIAGILTLVLASCSDVLDTKDTAVINPDIWNSEQSASLFINTLYNEMPVSSIISSNTSPFGNLSNCTEESLGSNKFINGEYTYDGILVFNDTYYGKIRNINIALEMMETSSLTDKARGRIVGQAYFLRAWAYWNLVIVYGGVPYITASVNPFEDDSVTMDPPRNKTSECIQYICDDLDKAIAALPGKVTEYQKGATEYARVTKATAAALKGRVLLFYASPQFNPQNDVNRWEAAYTANMEAKQIADENGFGLITGTSDPVSGAFANLFLKEGADNKEALFVKAYDATVSKTHGWDNSVRPNVAGVSGGQSCNPTWDMVKAFPMKNGLATNDASSGFDSTYYWKDRDPRFYATIAYNGCTWALTGMEGTTIWTYNYSNTEKINGTISGFYCRKMTNPGIDKTKTNLCGTDWIEIRYAEVLMNLAECANETNRQGEAIELLKQIRSRAGIDTGDGYYGLKSSYSNPVDLTAIIMNERLIEFAYENKRMWDMRRRNMYIEDLGSYKKLNGRKRWQLLTDLKYPSGVNTSNQKSDYATKTFQAKRDTINLNTRYTTYFVNKFSQSVGDVNYPIAVPEKYGFFGIPQIILNRSKAIKQTQGWGNGIDEFNPYE